MRITIGCRDVFGRPGRLVLFLDEDTGQVGVASPAGECALLDAAALDALHQAVGDARQAAARGGWTAWTRAD